MIHTPQQPQPPSLPQTVRSPPLVVTAANTAAAMTDKFPRVDGLVRPTAFSAYQPMTMTAASVPATTIRRPSPPFYATGANTGGSTLLTPTMPFRPIPIPAATVSGNIITTSPSAFRRTLITAATVAVATPPPDTGAAPRNASSPSAIDALTGVVKKSDAAVTTFTTPTFAVDPNTQYPFAQHGGAIMSPVSSAVVYTTNSTTSIISPTPMAVEATVVPGAVDYHNTGQSTSDSQSVGDAVVASLTATFTKSSAAGTAVPEVEQILQQSHQRRSSQSLQTLVTTFANALKQSQPQMSPSLSSPALNERTMSFDECAQLVSLVVSNMEAAEELSSPSSSSHSCPNCSSSNKGSRWSPSDDTAMLKLIDSGLDFSVIATKLKRTVRALKDRYCLLKKNKSSISSSSSGAHGHSADHNVSGSHRHFSTRHEDDGLDGDESSTSSAGAPDKKRSRQRGGGHRQREHRGDRQRSSNKRVKAKKRDNGGRSTYEDDETRALSAGSSSDSEDEHHFRHRPQSLPSSATVPLGAVTNQTPASPIKNGNNGANNNAQTDSNGHEHNAMDESGGHRHHTHTHHHHSGHHNHHNRRRSSHSSHSHQSLSPASPPHLDEMDVSSDDDYGSVTSDDRSSRSSISRDDETSALDSLTKLSHMTELMEKPQLFRQQSATSLLVAVANM